MQTKHLTHKYFLKIVFRMLIVRRFTWRRMNSRGSWGALTVTMLHLGRWNFPLFHSYITCQGKTPLPAPRALLDTDLVMVKIRHCPLPWMLEECFFMTVEYKPGSLGTSLQQVNLANRGTWPGRSRGVKIRYWHLSDPYLNPICFLILVGT